MHLLLFWGAVLLLIATALNAVEFNWDRYLAPHTGFEFPTTRFRLQTGLVWDLAGLMALVGAGMAAWRRSVIRPKRLETFADDAIILSFIVGLIVTGFLLEGLRMGATELNPFSGLFAPRQAWFSPGGYLFAWVIRGAGATPGGMEVAHRSIWWLHVAITALAFVYAGVRVGKLRHLLVSPLNVFLRPARPVGVLRPMGDLEALDRFGARDLTDFTWKQLLDWDACTDCGRCQDRCPAWASGKALSPRKAVQDLRRCMDGRDRESAYETVSEEAIWACTTCGACDQVCPVAVRPTESILELRRYLAMEEGLVPPSAQEVLLSLEQRGHPWRGTPYGRMDWAEGLTVKTLREHPDAEMLLWVGCTAALEQRSQKISRAMAKVMLASGVDFAVLGEEETCTGDPARRLGNEYLFQMLAEQNINTLNGYGVRRIVTLCPHCFNTFKNEYPQFGGNYEVTHYTQLLDCLLREGRLKPGDGIAQSVAYHDSCYLGRLNGIYDAPRRVIDSVGGAHLVEMSPRIREEGFCCGAGGGHMWIEEDIEERVSGLRLEQFLSIGADTLGVSCPFCLQMLDEGFKSTDATDKRVCDIVELIADSLDQA
jgi:Fe-S oxidoreductase